MDGRDEIGVGNGDGYVIHVGERPARKRGGDVSESGSKSECKKERREGITLKEARGMGDMNGRVEREVEE